MARRKTTTRKPTVSVVPSDDARLKKVEAILNSPDLEIGTLRGKFAKKEEVRGVISTGGLGLDIALGVRGLPKGRIVEIFGMEGSGKTTLTLHMIAECQRAGGVAAFVDAEHALDVAYAEALGINTEQLLFHQPDTGEEGLTVVESLVTAGVDLVIVDSVAALVPKAELEGAMGDAHVGLQARLMSQAMRKITAKISKTNSIVVFINQMRDKIGVTFGSSRTTTGGNALKFYASIRIEVYRKSVVRSGGSESPVIGNRVVAKVVKNRTAPPFRQSEFDLVFGQGIDTLAEILDFGISQKVIKKSGSWYSYGKTRIGQGRVKVKDWLEEHPDVCEKIRQAALGSVLSAAPDDDEEPEGIDPEEMLDLNEDEADE